MTNGWVEIEIESIGKKCLGEGLFFLRKNILFLEFIIK